MFLPVKLKTIPKLEKLNHIWKFVTVTDYAAIVMDNHGFDKDHYCVMAEVCDCHQAHGYASQLFPIVE